jgi:hypothetical protein
MQTDYVRSYFAAKGKSVDSVQVLSVPTSLSLIDDLGAFDYVFDYSSGLALGYAAQIALNGNAQKWFKQPAVKPSQVFKDDLMFLMKLVDDVTCSTFGWTERVRVTDYLDDLLLYRSDQSNNYIVNPQISAANIRLLFSRSIRATGVRQIFLIAGTPLIDEFLSVIKEFRVEAGYAVVIFGANCLFSKVIYPTGVICAAYEGFETSKSSDENEVGYILRAVEGKSLEELNLFNLVLGSLVNVGKITPSKLALTSPLVFPGNKANPPKAERLEIVVVMNDYFINTIPSKEFNWQRSIPIAFADRPLNNPHFVIKAVSVPECATFSQTTGYMACLSKAFSLKATIMLSTSEIPETVYAIFYMKSTGLTLPYIEARLPVDILSSATTFPFFTRVMSTLDYFISHSVLINIKYGFKKINLMLSNYYGAALMQRLIKVFRISLEVFTPDNLLLKDDYVGDNYFADVCKSIYDSAVRPVYVFMSPNNIRSLLLECYDQGLRSKDVVFLGIAVDNDKVDYRAKLSKEFGYVYYNDCASYDLGLTTVQTLDFAIRRGLNFYKTEEMIRAVRFSRFRGCTGDVQLGFNDNNRKDSMLSGYQVLMEDGEPNVHRVLDISIINSPTFRDVVWYDNSNNTPNYERYTYKDCPFPEEWRLSLPYSQARTAWAMLGFVATVTGIAVAAKVRFFRFKTLKDIPRPILLSTQDMFIFGVSLFEPVQYLVLAPCQDFLNAISRDLFKRAFWNDIDFQDGRFWLFINSLFAVFGFWLSILFMTWLSLRRNSLSNYQFLLFILSRIGNFAFIFGLLTLLTARKARQNSMTRTHQLLWT